MSKSKTKITVETRVCYPIPEFPKMFDETEREQGLKSRISLTSSEPTYGKEAPAEARQVSCEPFRRV